MKKSKFTEEQIAYALFAGHTPRREPSAVSPWQREHYRLMSFSKDRRGEPPRVRAPWFEELKQRVPTK